MMPPSPPPLLVWRPPWSRQCLALLRKVPVEESAGHCAFGSLRPSCLRHRGGEGVQQGRRGALLEDAMSGP